MKNVKFNSNRYCSPEQSLVSDQCLDQGSPGRSVDLACRRGLFFWLSSPFHLWKMMWWSGAGLLFGCGRWNKRSSLAGSLALLFRWPFFSQKKLPVSWKNNHTKLKHWRYQLQRALEREMARLLTENQWMESAGHWVVDEGQMSAGQPTEGQ